MGYDYVELGHSTPVFAREGILKALDEGFIKVSSCHNFCPMPPFAVGPAPNMYSPATKSEAESTLWFRYTANTIAMAKEVEAKAIVCHCGQLTHFFRPLDATIYKLLEQDKKLAEIVEDKGYIKVKEKYIKKAGKRSQRHYAFIRENLLKLEELLKDSNINIGIENRDNPPELPFDWNLDQAHKDFFDDIPYAKSWHDVGHAKKRELYGLYNQEKLLEETRNRLIGWHLQDCDEEGKDHLALGEGCVDFKMLSKYFDKNKDLFIFEINNRQDRQKVIDSKKILEDLL